MADDLDLASADERRGAPGMSCLRGCWPSLTRPGYRLDVSVDSTIARAHQHATNITRDTGG